MSAHQSDIDQQELVKLYRKALASGKSIDEISSKVEKKVTRLKVANQVEKKFDQKKYDQLKKSIPAAVRLGAFFLPVVLIVVGFLLLGSAVVPILGFYAKNLTAEMKKPNLIAPIPQEKILDVTPLIVAQADFDQEPGEKLQEIETGPVVVDAELDYTNLSNWFEDEALAELENRTSLLSSQTGEYMLEIPELDIHNAVVKIGGTDLDESLIQYPGTSLPGKPGSPVVFGHSVLRQFYNPKESNPRRYNSIFSTIMTLEKGDKFYVKYGDVKYTYVVKSKKEVKPTDTYILSQEYK